jgi:hypothetical protein
MLAQEAASLDRLSGGRFILGLGAGGVLDAIPEIGGPALTRGGLDRGAAGGGLPDQASVAGRPRSDHHRAIALRREPTAVRSRSIQPARALARMRRRRTRCGATGFVIWPFGDDLGEQIDAFATQVWPAVDRD